ncbi:MAG: exodeoxyribonuclease V subunit alpha [Actinobacteria bacterium]|nr:exodeoxyribonuclease V subunit alpha [Actinomycetota bacterium]
MTAVFIPPIVDGLRPFVEAQVFAESEVHLAATIARMAQRIGAPLTPEVTLAIAVAARGPRSGHVCLALDLVAELLVDERDESTDLPWPDANEWGVALIAADHVVATPDNAQEAPLKPLVLDGNRLYLQRYWVYEQRVASVVLERVSASSSLGWTDDDIDEALHRFFGPDTDESPDWQRRGARAALRRPFSVLAGGPGTGKTRTVARMLAAAQVLALRDGAPLHVGLAAPSGKAAARLAEAIELAVQQLLDDATIDAELAEVLRSAEATTIHRMLRANPRTGFGRDRYNPVPFDVVIIDETSMVSLPLMSALLDAIPARTHLVFVGDPDQLASVEAGTVLGDIVGTSVDDPTTGGHGVEAVDGPLVGSITVLRQAHRFGTDSGIAALANAVRVGDVDAALAVLAAGRADVTWIAAPEVSASSPLLDEVVNAAAAAIEAARAGDVDTALEALTATKVLSATRRHRNGSRDWSDRIEAALSSRVDDLRLYSRHYVGRPIIVSQNDALTGVANGDVGVTVERDGQLVVAFDGNPEDRHVVPVSRLDQIETWWAMTIHKSQGSEFDHTIVALPPSWVPILTRELLYTGITRAKERVTVVGDESAIRRAVSTPVSRASGLRDRLWPSG